MVRLTATLFLIAGLIVSGLSTPMKRSAAQIQSDIATMSTQTTTLESVVNAFGSSGSGTLAELLVSAVHSSATTLVSSINTAATDVTATGPLSEADARSILDSVEAYAPKLLNVLTILINKKPVFDTLSGGSALVLQDVKSLHTAFISFMNSLIMICPADIVPEATTLKNDVEAGFASAIAAYS
ncbi:hydrophobic surface binding protein [Lyophyllum atratum]|nr:hydrophobic surface binding protein [Lyophyllum atratum]